MSDAADLASWLLEQVAEMESDACDYHDQLCEMFTATGMCSCGYPARVLAECEAKRQIIKRCELILAAFKDPKTGAWPDVNRRERSHAHMTLEALAAVYADRPGYREEWRP